MVVVISSESIISIFERKFLAPVLTLSSIVFALLVILFDASSSTSFSVWGGSNTTRFGTTKKE
jgi:hypothetical protein